jgi:hypothetical protein
VTFFLVRRRLELATIRINRIINSRSSVLLCGNINCDSILCAYYRYMAFWRTQPSAKGFCTSDVYNLATAGDRFSYEFRLAYGKPFRRLQRG